MVQTKQKKGADWERKDFWLGLLIFGMGTLMVAFVYLLICNFGEPGLLADVSAVVLAFAGRGGVLLGPLFVLLGGHAMYCALRAGAAAPKG